MFEFFIALFGGAYYSAKYANEKHELRSIDKEITNKNAFIRSLKSRVCADSQTEYQTAEYVKCGKHFDEICKELEEDFLFILGENWRSIIRIPKNYGDYSSLKGHSYWAYHLLLAKTGKMDSFEFSQGYCVGGIREKDANIRFAQRIEKRLNEAGVNVRLALELDMWYQSRRTPDQVCGGNIKIESVSYCPTHRLW